MTRHPFSPAAQPLWDSISTTGQERILDNVWCGHCGSARRIIDFAGVSEDGDIRLQGFCATCGHAIVRIIETSEAPTRS